MSDQVTFTDWEIEQALREAVRCGSNTTQAIAELCLKLKKSEEGSEQKIEELEEQIEKLEEKNNELTEENRDLKNDNENSGERIRKLEEEIARLEG